MQTSNCFVCNTFFIKRFDGRQEITCNVHSSVPRVGGRRAETDVLLQGRKLQVNLRLQGCTFLGEVFLEDAVEEFLVGGHGGGRGQGCERRSHVL